MALPTLPPRRRRDILRRVALCRARPFVKVRLMHAPRFLTHLSVALAASLALAAAVFAEDDVDPEPPGGTREEAAVQSVDLDKAKTDKKVAAQADRDQKSSQSNLTKIASAVHSYNDAKGFLPDDTLSKANKPLLSWRVAILPYVGQKALYEKFKLDEPWDSAHNKKLIAKMPDVFRSPRVKLKGKGNTVYQVFTGSNAVFGRGQALRFPAAIPDGTSNTIMAVESSTAVPWTKPGGLPFDRNKALPTFGKAYGQKPLAALFDGSVRVLDLNVIKPETLKNAIDPADGFPLGNDW
jgi:hypothetical protein